MIMEIGYKDDKIFLLSEEEYELLKDNIDKYCDKLNSWWWLRSPGDSQSDAALVSHSGSIIIDDIGSVREVVRPAFKIEKSNASIGEELLIKTGKHYSVFVKIYESDNYDIYLANRSIDFFTIDRSYNDYKTSTIRQILLNMGKKDC